MKNNKKDNKEMDKDLMGQDCTCNCDDCKDQNCSCDCEECKCDGSENEDKNINSEDLVKKIQELALTIDKVEDEKLVVENHLKKALADYANLEKNNERMVEIMLNSMKKEVSNQLIEIMDDIYYAFDASQKFKLEGETKAWLEGVKGTLSKIQKVLDSIGVTIKEVKVGEPYNPECHEAIGVVNEGKKDSIHQVVQQCYMIGDAVIRPARVIVAKGE